MVSIDSTLLAALISALVSLVVVVFNTNYLEPRREKIENKTYRRQLLCAWISDVNANLRALGDKQRHLEDFDRRQTFGSSCPRPSRPRRNHD